MKSILLFIVTAITLTFFPNINFGQVITLGPDASKFVLFTSSGAVGDNASAHSHITGDVGTLTPGPITGFGNIDGVMHPGVDPATTACEIALQATIAQINANPATLVGPLSLGSGATLTPGIYSIPGNATLTLDLILDGQGNPNAEFVFKVAGTFATNTLSRVKLINGAQACHIFWKIDGAVTMASLSTMRGNIISGGLIQMGSGDSLEGRAFSTPAGAITIDGITAFTPIGCGSPVLSGPPAPDLASLFCYTIFSSIGALDGNLSSTSIGDVGNAGGGTVTGWTAGNVIGTLHPTGDPSTMQAAIDLTNVYNTINAMPVDIELLYPVEFGRNLVLTPHVYLMNSALNGPATLTDSLYLDAQGNANAVFVIKIINGALTTSVNSRVKLINGTQAKNVFWMVDGAVDINDNSIFCGNIIVSAGALNLRFSGVQLFGRALTINGAITTAGLTAIMPPGCGPCNPVIITQPISQTACVGDSISFIVEATGADLTYQWRNGAVNISGATNDTLTIDPVSILDGGLNYNVVVSGSCAPAVTSINVSLTITPAPVIITEPMNQNACVGDSVSFIVVATGTGLTYQWRNGAVNISGATNDTLTIDPVSILDAGLNYNVIVTNACSSDTSIFAALILSSAPIIITEPMNQIACVGDSVSFTVSATGAGLTYQWRNGTVNISGATNDTLTFDPVSILDAGLNYNVIVTGACSSDTSIFASLTVNNGAIIITEPVNQTACVGDSISFVVVANGTGLTYQWRKGIVNIIGATNDTLTIDPISLTDAALNYNVVITGTCSSVTSINVSLTVNTAPIIILQPVSQTACVGDSISFVVVANGTGLNYQWRKGIVDILGATNDTLTIDPVALADAASDYNVVITGTCAGTTSLNVSLTVNTDPLISLQPADQSVCEGESVTFFVSATGTGLTYQWRIGTTFITGATNSALTINPVSLSDTATDYNVVITGVCSVVTSINVSLVVFPIPIAIASSNSPVCEGVSINLVAQTVTGATYEWASSNGYSSTDQNPVINSGALTDNGIYSLVVTANGCTSAPSSIEVIVNVCEDKDFFIPEGFSPNGDGTNDLFVIRGILYYPDNTFEIFNRWGNKVFEASPYQNTWDGNSTMGLRVGGEQLPVGTYFYVLDLGDGSPIYKGTIYLNK